MAKKKPIKKAAARAKKKAAPKKKASAKKTGKKVVAKKAAKKKAAPKKSAASSQKRAPKAASSKATPSTKAKRDDGPSLGRPTAKVDAKLDDLFLRDFKAREVFDFLNVDTLRDLEQFSPEEIVEKLTAPMVQTVTRIRKALAIRNRSLKGDKSFAAEFKAATQGQVGRVRPNK
jgi:hypothetical protein